jgi:hypothetical protein
MKKEKQKVNESPIMTVELSPKLGNSHQSFIDFCKKLELKLKGNSISRIEILERVRRDSIPGKDLLCVEEIEFQFVISVVIDLLAQGWEIKASKSKVEIWSPAPQESHVAKETVRMGHLLGRNAQLREKSVTEFIRNMEKRRLHQTGWHSIFSLMRDGRDLAEKLREVNLISDEKEKEESLQSIISPYLQVVEGDAKCEHTGLRLGDMWRYFRHTWVNEYKSIPGRSIMILIRDKAAPNHPVIGIAALGSSVVQHGVRDRWIGWQAKTFVKELSDQPNIGKVKWLVKSLNKLIKAIYIKDLLYEKLLEKEDIEHPTEYVISKLLEESERAIKKHRHNPQKESHKIQKVDQRRASYWETEALTHLYRSKRCRQLSKLMSIRRIFWENNLLRVSEATIRDCFKSSKVQSAVAQLIRMIKAEHVGVNMMDITVCGSIAPYNHLLGGKLICMLLCSPEITQYYSKRYGDQISVIASSIKGRPVIRKPNLVLLCTTSLYGVGSSQYNRVKIPIETVRGKGEENIVYENLGHSYGFGTYHFSKETIQLGSVLISRRKEGRLVNSIFGEGVNPLMRKIREALELVGLQSDVLLLHGNRRVTYGIRLAKNFKEILLGLEDIPDYLMDQSQAKHQTDRIADFWRHRWLINRIANHNLLEKVEEHTLTYPINHGAVVPLEKVNGDGIISPLW